MTEFDELHERRMHLIVVRRDGGGFQHLHPEIDEAGTWTTAIELPEAGVYRAFADFSVDGEQHTLASDLFVSGGEFEARPFPAPAPVAATGGYEVRLARRRAGCRRVLDPGLRRQQGRGGGRRPRPLPRRQGPPGGAARGRPRLPPRPSRGAGGEAAPDEIAFGATFPTAGRYRLYLQFKHEGAVRTAEFTVEVSR